MNSCSKNADARGAGQLAHDLPVAASATYRSIETRCARRERDPAAVGADRWPDVGSSPRPGRRSPCGRSRSAASPPRAPADKPADGGLPVGRELAGLEPEHLLSPIGSPDAAAADSNCEMTRRRTGRRRRPRTPVPSGRENTCRYRAPDRRQAVDRPFRLRSFSPSGRAASRSHIAVFGSTGPSERYSAIPSMNQSGAARAVLAGPAGRRHVELKGVDDFVADDMVGSASGPPSGSTMRRRSDSVTPPVPSPSSP